MLGGCKKPTVSTWTAPNNCPAVLTLHTDSPSFSLQVFTVTFSATTTVQARTTLQVNGRQHVLHSIAHAVRRNTSTKASTNQSRLASLVTLPLSGRTVTCLVSLSANKP